MGSRFLAACNAGLSGDEAGALAARVGLDIAYHGPGLTLLVERDAPMLALDDGATFVIGHLFCGGSGRALTAIEAPVQAAIRGTRGVRLIDGFWGGYVAILHDPVAGTTDLLRDPSGTVPCYHVAAGGATVAASDAVTLVQSGWYGPQIDWSYLVSHYGSDLVRPARTGLIGLNELLRGQRLTVGDGYRQLAMLWSPWDFAASDRQIRDRDLAADALRQTLLGCIGAWSSAFGHVVLGVSGGLDSSIVAAALVMAGAKLSCVTLATDAMAGDERPFARVLADGLDVHLDEVMEDLSLVDVLRSEADHLPRPVARLFAQSGDRLQLRVAEARGADAFMTGGGGDNVFCFLHSVAPVADRILVDGIGPGALQTARDVARLAQCSLWEAGRGGLRRAWSGRRGYAWPRRSRFLSAEARDHHLVAFDHPWLDVRGDSLPGKAMHVAWLMSIENHLEGFHREKRYPVVSPLMAQPIVELCLRIPTWLWCAEGRDRAIARNAFRELLPPAILDRRSKGTPTSFVLQIFDANRPLIRSMLADGLLAQRGLLDVDAIVDFVDNPHPAMLEAYMAVMALVDVEAWARAWSGRQAHASEKGRG